MSFGRFRDDTASKSSPTGSDNSPKGLGLGGAVDKREAYIGKGSKLSGSHYFSGPTELDCHIEGEIEAQDGLVIGESAFINASIKGLDIIVKGSVQGDISASKRLVLKRTARVFGTISSPSLSIEEGGIVEGKIAMAAAAEKKNLENTPKSQLNSKSSLDGRNSDTQAIEDSKSKVSSPISASTN